MYSKKTLNRLKEAVKQIEDIEEMVKAKNGVNNLLEDELFGRKAVMKSFDIMAEQFEKIKNSDDSSLLAEPTIEKDYLGLKGIRNESSHNYFGVDFNIIKNTIENFLPNFKKNIQEILKEIKKELCKNLEKNVDYFTKKQNILMPQAKTDLIKTIEKEYKKLQENNIKLDKSYSNKIKNIIKENSKENQR